MVARRLWPAALARFIALPPRSCTAEIMIFLRKTNVILRLVAWAAAGFGWLGAWDVLGPLGWITARPQYTLSEGRGTSSGQGQPHGVRHQT